MTIYKGKPIQVINPNECISRINRAFSKYGIPLLNDQEKKSILSMTDKTRSSFCNEMDYNLRYLQNAAINFGTKGSPFEYRKRLVNQTRAKWLGTGAPAIEGPVGAPWMYSGTPENRARLLSDLMSDLKWPIIGGVAILLIALLIRSR